MATMMNNHLFISELDHKQSGISHTSEVSDNNPN